MNTRYALLIVLLAGLPARAADEPTARAMAELITPAAERSIEKGLAWLASRQHDDGSFGAGPYRGNVAVVGLGGLAMLSSGSTPGRGAYGGELDKCVDYLVAHTQQGGYILAPSATSHGPMYGHGFATLFLAEAYGMSRRAELRDKLAGAVKLIVNTQNKQGGWRYYPQRADADISVTVCQVMALRAARNAGIYVPNETIDRSIEYVKKCQNADGGFMYMLESGGESAFPRSAAGVVALYSAGVYEGAEIDKGLEYLMEYLPKEGAVRREMNYYEYGHYYAVQAMWQAGDERFKTWYPAIRDELIARQREDGSWPSAFGADYATAMCLLVLQVPNHALPIFER